VSVGSAQYGDFAWTVPEINSATVRVVIFEYGNPGVVFSSGQFTITPSQSASSAVVGSRRAVRPLRGITVVAGAPGCTVHRVSEADASVEMYRMVGSRVDAARPTGR